MTKARKYTRIAPHRDAYVEASIAQAAHLMNPDPPVDGPRITLHPCSRWPANAWTVITITIARTTDDASAKIPENAMQQGQERRLIQYLTGHPTVRDTIDSQLHHSGYEIAYPQEEP